jgi:uncharacterized repeat protein (TIGR01451 family)
MDLFNTLLEWRAMRFWPIALAIIPVLAGSEPAPDKPPIEVRVIVERLVTEPLPNGREQRRFVPAGRIQEDDEIYYTVRIRNATGETVTHVTVARPIPANTIYVAGSAVGPAAVVTFSVDGGLTFASADALATRSPDGLERPASAADYTHIRWQLNYPLAPGATALARFRARLK